MLANRDTHKAVRSSDCVHINFFISLVLITQAKEIISLFCVKPYFGILFCPNLFICWLLLKLGVKLCPLVGTGQVTYKVQLRAQESVQYIGGVFWGPACRSQRGFSSAQGALCIFLYTWRLETAPCLSLWLISRAHPMPTQKLREEGGHRVQKSSLSPGLPSQPCSVMVNSVEGLIYPSLLPRTLA